IQALARAHTLLTDAAWHQADLAALLHDQLLMDDVQDSRIVTSGPIVSLPPQLALHVALMVHELGTNARKHGALSLQSGKLSVSWSLEYNGACQLRLHWVEDSGAKPKIPAAEPTGFGMTLIQSIAGQGNAKIKSGARGVEWDISIRLPQEPAQNGRRVASGSKRATTEARPIPSLVQL